MKKIIGVLLFNLLFAVAAVSAQKDYCFESDGLKLKQIVRMVVIGNKIEGVMESGEYDIGNMETFDFTGAKTGKTLTIKFAGTVPYELAPGTKKIVWTFSPTVLKIPMYGKKSGSKKYAIYTADFKPCEN